MKKVKKYSYANENGLTLVEVLASIVILSIILVSILMILLQSMKAKQISEEIIDATYIAQTEMEKIYDQSRKGQKGVEDYVTEKEVNNRHYTIEVTFDESTNDLKKVLVQVYDSLDLEKPQAQMENLLEWKADDNEEATS